MSILTRLHVSGWKSIKDASLEFGRLNVLIGANGAGKSNLLSFFRFLRFLIEGRMDEFVSREGGANSLLHFGLKQTGQMSATVALTEKNESICFATDLVHRQPDALAINPLTSHPEPGNGEITTNLSVDGKPVGWIRGIPRPKAERHPSAFFKKIRQAHFHDTSLSTRGRLTGYVRDNQFLHEDAGNLAAMLYLYQQREPIVYQRIVSTVRKIVPNFGNFELAPEKLNPESILLKWRQTGHEDYLFGPHQLSDGSFRSIALTTLLLQPEEDLPRLLILDEPEIGLHLYALELIAGLIRAASVRTQVIVATQSSALVSFFEPEEILVSEALHGESSFRRLDAGALEEWLEEYSLGELWERNVIGGGPMP